MDMSSFNGPLNNVAAQKINKFIDYKILLKIQCKTTFNSAFVGKKNPQNQTRVDFGIMFLKNVVLHEI
jgi:hypothetical protein